MRFAAVFAAFICFLPRRLPGKKCSRGDELKKGGRAALTPVSYTHLDVYKRQVIRWQQKRNGAVGLTRECIGYENGVLGCLISAVNAFCTQGDAVLLHSPTYIGFTGNLGRNGYQMIFSPLVQDEDGVWRMDYCLLYTSRCV